MVRSQRVDAVVIGAGPAGLSAALSAGRTGLRVIVAENVDMRECMFSSYYICSAMKPFVGAATNDQDRPMNDNMSPDIAHRIAAE